MASENHSLASPELETPCRKKYVSGPQQQCEARLNVLVEQVLSKSLDRHIYIDTLVLLVEGQVKWKQRSVLYRLIGKMPIIRPSKFFGYTHIRLHRPNLETIQFITSELPKNLISRVDIALDFIVSDKVDAAIVSKMVLQVLTMKWKRKGQIIKIEETSYYDRQGKRRNIVAYHDRPSKITGEPVAHIEFRRFSAESCRSVGLVSAEDALTANLVNAIQRHAKLSTFNWPLVDKYIAEAAGAMVQRFGRKYPKPFMRKDSIARIKSMNARMIRDRDDLSGFDLLKNACPTQIFIDHQKETGMMPGPFLRALVGCDLYPLLKGALIIRPMEKKKIIQHEIMHPEQELA